MKYAELIHFEPIESVVQLRDADAANDAARLVETFVISARMAEQLGELVFPQLQFSQPADNKGMLVVGNYGTGKSHLMAVISAVAEHAELAANLTNPSLTVKAKSIAGRFKVIRAEIGSTTMSLRDILCGVLEDGLSNLGVSYQFPSTSERHENKSAFQEMMAAFQEKFPEHGLLLVVDELLDYLRSRKDQELSLDLSFLREVGEVCKGTRFRFLSGVQEGLFDNPRFQFVADTLRRVKDRFEQVRIAREDVAFVVSERLLKKDTRQQALIRDHLTKFAPLYGSMNERMDEFVRLFPVHPAYLDTFERVYVAEKREVLKTLSATIKRLIDKSVPDDQPGLVAYDSYWQTLKDNPSFRSIPEIREVIEKSGDLESRIQRAFTRPQYRPTALRIIQGLSVHRLTTGDIYAPLGATAEELRDDLCLSLPVPEKDAEFLKTLVETVLREIVKTVAGQFLSFNKENGQYFLDLKKDIDFDSLIEKKAESLDDSQLDRYYFEALRRVVLEDPDAPAYVTGYRIWEYELEWREKRAGRSGYLFFGAPNERSTAQPPRDFYLYFLQPFDAPYFKDEKKPDEVFFRLKDRDDVFDRAMKLYAGAREQAATASGSNKKIYEDKANDHLRSLTTWLRERITSAFEVSYQGRSRPLAEVIQGKVVGGIARATVRDFVNTAGSVLLAPHFEDRSSEYPTFTVLITRQNREQAAQEALRWISGGVKSKQGAAVLDALELLDGENLKPAKSRYAGHVLGLLSPKAHGHVLNRAELVQAEAGIEYWTRFRLEPEFLGVVLAALVYSGDIVLSIPGKKIDTASLDQFSKLSAADVRDFKHIERPKDLPLAPLQELCELLGVPKGLIVNPSSREEAVAQIQMKAIGVLNKAVLTRSHLGDLVVWGKPILSEKDQKDWSNQLDDLKDFLESLQPFNTAGKLKNFSHNTVTIQAQKQRIELIKEIDELLDLVQQISPLTSYLFKAESVFEKGNPWMDSVLAARNDLVGKIVVPKQRADPDFLRSIGQTLEDLKARFLKTYLSAHMKARLGKNEDGKKGLMLKDPRLTKLQKLSGVEMMPVQQFNDFHKRLLALRTCYGPTEKDLEVDPLCPHCGFRPIEEPDSAVDGAQVLVQLDHRLDELVGEWTETLLSNLSDPTVSGNIALVSDKTGRASLEAFVKNGELPDPISQTFVKALQEVLGGLQKIVVSGDQIRKALVSGGVPCTVTDLKERFDRLVSDMTKGKDVSKVRVVLE